MIEDVLRAVPFVKKLTMVDLGVRVVEEVFLADGDGVLQVLVLADGDHGVAHLQSPAVHHLLYVDVLPFPLHGLEHRTA